VYGRIKTASELFIWTKLVTICSQSEYRQARVCTGGLRDRI